MKVKHLFPGQQPGHPPAVDAVSTSKSWKVTEQAQLHSVSSHHLAMALLNQSSAVPYIEANEMNEVKHKTKNVNLLLHDSLVLYV